MAGLISWDISPSRALGRWLKGRDVLVASLGVGFTYTFPARVEANISERNGDRRGSILLGRNKRPPWTDVPLVAASPLSWVPSLTGTGEQR